MTTTNAMTTTTTTNANAMTTFDAIAWALSSANTNETARDIAQKSQRWTLSERQENYLLNAFKWANDRQQQARDNAQKGIVAPTGRVAVVGQIVSVKRVEGFYGIVTKVIVELPTGARVRGNAPASSQPEVGQTVGFTARFTQADGDASFAFWSHPKNWKAA